MGARGAGSTKTGGKIKVRRVKQKFGTLKRIARTAKAQGLNQRQRRNVLNTVTR